MPFSTSVGVYRVLFFAAGASNERLAHALAVNLRERNPDTRFAAVCTREFNLGTRENYLRHHTDGLFETVVSHAQLFNEAVEQTGALDSEALTRMEKAYGMPRLWNVVTADRLLSMTRSANLYREGSPYGREQVLRILQHQLWGIEALLDDFVPDLIVYAGVDTSAGISVLLNQVARHRGIPVLVPHRTRVGCHYVIGDSIFSRYARVEATFARLRNGTALTRTPEVRGLLERIRQGSARYPSAAAPPHSAASKLRLIATAVGDALSRRTADDRMEPRTRDRFRDSVVRRVRKARLRLRPRSEPADFDRRYAFFPLHSEPELALQLYAPFHTDQLGIVRNVAQALPVGTVLYVKEHPYALQHGLRAPAFYDALRRIPNVRLVSGDTHALIEHAEAVVTITGTAGIEALLMQKPVFTFGEVFYNACEPYVTVVRDVTELPRLYDEALAREPDEAVLEAFVGALLEHAIELPAGTVLDLQPTTPIDPDRLDAYVDFLLRHVPAERAPSTLPDAMSPSGDSVPSEILWCDPA